LLKNKEIKIYSKDWALREDLMESVGSGTRRNGTASRLNEDIQTQNV